MTWSWILACKATPPVAPLHTFETLDGARVQIPDPGGRPVVVELVRSLDW